MGSGDRSSQDDKPLWFKYIPHQARCMAFLWHLLISICAVALVFAVVYLYWFPHALAMVSGGLQGLTIVALVDLVLGPTLTFVVYDIAKTKRHLIRDLGVIAGLQITCLVAGVVTVYQVKPVAVVHVFDTFHVLSKPDYEALDMDTSILDTFPGAYPKLLYVDTESNAVAFRIKNTLDQLNRQQPLHLQLNSYQLIPQNKQELLSLFHGDNIKSDGGCYLQNISSVYLSGTVCFDGGSLKFTDFIEGGSISHVESLKSDEGAT